LIVFLTFEIFELEKALIPFIKFSHQDMQGPCRFHFGEDLIGGLLSQSTRSGRPGLPLVAQALLGSGIGESLPLVIPVIIVGTVPDTPEEPGPGLLYIVPVLMQTQKGILHQILRHLAAPYQSEGVA
jgi:hypothetical protein